MMGPVRGLAPWGLEAQPRLAEQPVPNLWEAGQACEFGEVGQIRRVGGKTQQQPFFMELAILPVPLSPAFIPSPKRMS